VTARIASGRSFPGAGVFDPLLLVAMVGVLAVLAVPATLRVFHPPWPHVSVPAIAGVAVPATARPLLPPFEDLAGLEGSTSPAPMTRRPAGRIADPVEPLDSPLTMPYELPEGFASLAIDPMPAPDAIALDDLTIAPLETY
jgi:hypothetical protein